MKGSLRKINQSGMNGKKWRERERREDVGDSWNSLGMTYSKVDLGQLERIEQFEMTEAGPGGCAVAVGGTELGQQGLLDA